MKEKMKFGSQELPILTNHFLYHGRDQMNDKFNVLIDHIWNIPKTTSQNENHVVSIKKGIICALYNFCNADNQGLPILTKASPSGKGYTYFSLLSGPHKGVFTNFADLCTAKEGIQNPRYKGFYTKEEAEKSLELDTINPETIKKALSPEPIQIKSQGNSRPSTYKEQVVSSLTPLKKETNLKRFKILQKFLLKIHRREAEVLGIYVKVQAYFNSRNVCCRSDELCSKVTNGNCPCKIKYLFRKAAIDMEQYKTVEYDGLALTPKLFLEYGLLDSMLIPPSKKFDQFSLSENEAINYLQAIMMNHIALKITSCPPRINDEEAYATHVIKILFDDHTEYPILYNEGYEAWEILGNLDYQYNLFRAQIMGYDWFFSETDEANFNLIKETPTTKMFLPVENGKVFLPFAQETNNKLVQHFQREKMNRKIYEASGCFGQQTPSNDISMSETSENPETTEEFGETSEIISVTRKE